MAQNLIYDVPYEGTDGCLVWGSCLYDRIYHLGNIVLIVIQRRKEYFGASRLVWGIHRKFRETIGNEGKLTRDWNGRETIRFLPTRVDATIRKDCARIIPANKGVNNV